METSHIIAGLSGVWIRWQLASSAETLCGISDYQGSAEDAALCRACEVLAGWDKHDVPQVPPDKVPSAASLNAVASQAATEHGYLLAPVGTEVCRRTDGRNVEKVPAWEAVALHHLLRNKHVTRGGLVLVTHGRHQRHMYEVETKR